MARFPDHLDLFTTASDGRIMSTWWNARTRLGQLVPGLGRRGVAGSPVTAIARYSSHLDLFVHRHRQSHLQHLVARSGDWAGWFNVSGGVGNAGGQVAAISRVTEHIDLFTVGADGLVYSTWWDGATAAGPGWFQSVVR